VSGGQTGPDRAALDFAVAHDVQYGGWCPRGGWAEDYRNPPGLLTAYPCLLETASDDVDERTQWNVRDSDATLILTRPGVDSKGTDLAKRCASELNRPCAEVALDSAGAEAAVEEFLRALGKSVALNVAGPRESESKGIYKRSLRLLSRGLLERTWLDQAVEADRQRTGLPRRMAHPNGW
jgi:hypothetical protein